MPRPTPDILPELHYLVNVATAWRDRADGPERWLADHGSVRKQANDVWGMVWPQVEHGVTDDVSDAARVACRLVSDVAERVTYDHAMPARLYREASTAIVTFASMYAPDFTLRRPCPSCEGAGVRRVSNRLRKCRRCRATGRLDVRPVDVFE